ncbi:hypothetical protein EB796_010675 [Bugula neritina]|uniref:Uncharacterized protein n=1 Tax=Bugula neritina TaxID=10212 RepID=A0A7J7JX73_BUGNE|nr:hypothetical protein EB796_010675 [Bugula neritina]
MRVLAIIACVIAVAVAYKSCKTDKDCGETECCIRNPLRVLRYGRCYQHQIAEGESCDPAYEGHCGCEEGTECMAATVTKFNIPVYQCLKPVEGSGEGSGDGSGDGLEGEIIFG